MTHTDAGTTPRRWGRIRSIVAAILIVLSAALAPIAVIGAWARLELVDPDRFVSTFAPLAERPEVQSFLADEVTRAIDENVDLNAVVADALSGLDGLNLPPRASSALRLLAGSAAEGIRGQIASAVHRTIASPAFANVWQTTLRTTHTGATAVLRDEPGTALSLDENGTLSIDLAPVIDRVRAELVRSGIGIAGSIPTSHRMIPLVTSESLVRARLGYQLVVAIGAWLPWLVLVLTVGGITLAQRRLRALTLTAMGLSLSLLVLAIGLSIGRHLFLGTMSPSDMPAATAGVIFDQLTGRIATTVAILIPLAVVVMLGSWIAGSSRSARALRRRVGATTARLG